LAIAVPALAFGAPFATPRPSSVPLLSGTYLLVMHNYCQPVVGAIYDSNSNDVANIELNTNYYSTINVGTAVFTQGKTSGAGTMKIGGSVIKGMLFQLKNNSGTFGAKWGIGKENQSGTFSQTSNTLIFDVGGVTQSSDIYYGKVSGGVAQSVVLAAAGGRCELDGTATRQ
jgi:hypothetical protein